MYAPPQTTGSTAPLERSLVEEAPPDAETVLRTINELERATIHPRPSAAVCGATGCSEGDGLALVDINSVPERVLCPIHVLDYVDQELPRESIGAAASPEAATEYLEVEP